ncbi:MAG: hypothetical protein ABFC96_06860 [Thermoguttaceae bacterium]
MNNDPREANRHPAHSDKQDKKPLDATLLDEQLVAYLDGELDAESGRRIEALLASDPEVRGRLQSLERTWDLLDELDAAPVGEPFTHTTLEMVAVAAREEVEQERAVAPRRRRRRRLAILGAILAAAVLGFLSIALLTPDPNRQLLVDLPVLVNLDEYRQVASVEFLRLLRKEKLFDAEATGTADAGLMAVDGPTAARRHRIESMSPEQKDELRRAAARFAVLGPADQQRLRQLDARVRSGDDSPKLQAVMHRYCDWLKSLPLYSRSELAELGPEARVKWVKRRLSFEDQAREGGGRLGGRDTETLGKWMNDCVERHEAAFLKTLPEPQRKRLSEFSDSAMRHRLVAGQMWLSWQRAHADEPGKMPPWVSENDLRRLRSQLSPQARKRLESRPTAQEQWNLVLAWMRHAMRPAASHAHGPLNPDDERLAAFFEKLPDEERNRLLSLPGEEMQRQLLRLYLTRIHAPGPPMQRGGGFDRPKRPGDDRAPKPSDKAGKASRS